MLARQCWEDGERMRGSGGECWSMDWGEAGQRVRFMFEVGAGEGGVLSSAPVNSPVTMGGVGKIISDCE